MRRGALLVLLLVLLPGSMPARGEAAHAVAEFNAGNRAYAAGDYEEAARRYEAALAAGARNHGVFFNLGNAHFKAGRVGRAILAYERGLRLAPRDADLRFNLRFARMSAVDQVEEPEKSFLEDLSDRAAGAVSVPLVIHVAILLYLLACTSGLLAVAFRARPGLRAAMLWAAAGALALLLLFAPLVLVKLHRDVWTRRGVVLEKTVAATSGPGKEFATVFTIHEGLVVTVREVRGDWAQVTIPSGFSGWLPRTAFEEI